MKLSVALCTYNGERFLKEQLLSIVNQFVPVNEIIICDDISTDNTISIIRDFEKKYSNISFSIYINKIRLGVVKNFEKAIRKCTGDIIFLSDQDDVWQPYKTKEILLLFEKDKLTECVYTDAQIIDGHNQLITNYSLFEALGLDKNVLELCKNNLTYLVFIAWGNRMTGATMAFRSELRDNFLPFRTDMKEIHDGQIALSSLVRNSIKYIDKPLIKYRIHGNNTLGLGHNWIFTSSINPYHRSDLYFPHPLRNSLFNYTQCPRFTSLVNFHSKRVQNIQSFYGRVKILFNFLYYIKYFNKFAIPIYYTDLTIGLSAFFKRKIEKLLVPDKRTNSQ